MRLVAIPLFALTVLTGCMSVHAKIPEDVVRRHAARDHGVELASICSLEGQSYSEGAVACMAGGRMTCDPSGRWVRSGDC